MSFAKAIPLAVILAAALSSSAGAINPGQPNPADVHAVEACLKSAKTPNASFESCIGVVARACQGLAQIPQGKTSCSQREETVWNEDIARKFARLATTQSLTDLQASLREAETAYERAKLTLCTFERIVGHNNPEALFAASMCRLNASARHDLWLTDQFDKLLTDGSS